MEFLLLGELEVRGENGPVALAAPKQRALLAALLLRANHVVPTDQLLIDLWGEDALPAARNNLQVLVHRLRRSLGDNRLVRRGDGYLLLVLAGELDVDRFEQARADAARAFARGDHALAAEGFRSALSLLRGPPLADLRHEPFAHIEAERLEELALATVEDRIDAELAAGENGDLVSELRARVAEHPLRERLRGQLMLALYRSGRQSEALEEYGRLRAVLHEELGLEPGPALRELERAILRQEASLDAVTSPAAADRHTPADRRRRPPSTRRMRLTVGATGLVAASLATALVAVIATHGTPRALAGVAPNSVGVIDPDRNAVVAQVPVGQRPIGVAVGAGAVWVANADDRTVSRIDPVKRAVSRNIRVETRQGDIAVQAGRVWVVGKTGRRNDTKFEIVLSRINPEVGEVVETARFGGTVGTWGLEEPVRVAAESTKTLWIASGWQFTRIGIARDHVMRTIDEFSSIKDFALDKQAIWVADTSQAATGGRSAVMSVDPSTGAVGARISVADEPAGIAAGGGTVWVASDNGTVTRIDPAAKIATATIELGGAPSDIVFGAGAVWVANSEGRNVARIDPQTNEVVATIPTRSRPDAIAFGDGKVWVTAY